MSVTDLEALIDRILRLEDQRSGLSCSIHEILTAAKASGLDTRIMRRAMRLCERTPGGRATQRDVLDAYNEAVGIGMLESWF